MSGGGNKAILANPANWLANNILIVAINPTNNKDRALAFDQGTDLDVNLVKVKDKATNAAGKGVNVWQVVRGSANPSRHSHQFRAYFLPWMQNGKKVMTLNKNGVDWFFTDTMNGCTFASGPGANPKVGHFNYQVDNTKIDATKINTEVGGEFGMGTNHRIDKTDYMDQHGLVKVTTLGIKTGNSWDFYYQKREIVSLIPPKWTLPAGQPVAIP